MKEEGIESSLQASYQQQAYVINTENQTEYLMGSEVRSNNTAGVAMAPATITQAPSIDSS